VSTLTTERLYSLLPAIYQIRDAEQGEPLKALLAAFATQLAVLEENVEQLYDDQFIETCADWVTPYIGDLIGYRPLHGVSPRISSPRAEVANTIAFRRRKGTALMLEELAQAVTDWPAHAVEFFEQLATTQYMKHLRPYAPATADTRNLRSMLQCDGPFNAVSHTAELRRPEAGSGRYNIPNVGIFLWRLLALPLTAVPLTPDPTDASGRRLRVNPLGADLRLFRHPQTEADISHLAEPINVPEPLGVRLMALAVEAAQSGTVPAPDAVLDDDYGPGESCVLLRPGDPPTPVPVAEVRVCDLRDILDNSGNVIGWSHEQSVSAGTIGIDPERGRVLLGATADGPLLASFHYGQARAIGGGEYQRTPDGADLATQTTVSGGDPLQPQLDAIAGGGRLLIGDSLTYVETPTLRVDDVLDPDAPGLTVCVTARNPARPLIAASGTPELAIGARGRLVIEGLVVSGGSLHLAAAADDETRELVLRDCTLVPGLTLGPDGTPTSPGAPSLIIEHPFAKVTLERCITGPVRIVAGGSLQLQGCILDAGAPANVALDADGTGAAAAELTAIDCTIVGKVHTRLMRLVASTICLAELRVGPPADTWTAPVIAERRQEGCVRFSYIPVGSITPRRYRCIPDAGHPDALPHFTSLRYGDPGYGQLRHATDQCIREGADDGSEIGVLRPLYQPQRETNLRIRLDEYLRFGLHAGIFYAT
jgi:hypothetical protein